MPRASTARTSWCAPPGTTGRAVGGAHQRLRRAQGLLPSLDVLICSEEEALLITHVANGDLDEAINMLVGRGCPLVVVTRGEKGALAASGAQRWHQGALARDVVDTTGAGDAFAAGFLYGWCQARDVGLGLQFGCACGSAAVGQMGGSHPLDPEAINRCMATDL